MNKPDIYNRDKALVHIKKSGLKTIHLEVWATKFKSLRSIAPKRGCKCRLTLSQYVKLGIKAGMTSPDQIGKSLDQYQMGRIGDTGNYEWGNCRFITTAQNLNERTLNGGTAVAVEKAAEQNRKSFVLKSPSGKVYKDRNLFAFAKKHDLAQGHLSLVCRGKKPHHKGWTGSYV